MSWKNGHKYEGEWKDSEYHGRGRLTFGPDHQFASYDGDFADGKRQGQGVMIWKDGQKYEGQWQDDSQHGRGKMTYAPGGRLVSYDGDFASGKRQGQGVLIWADGEKYEGQWKDDDINGQGFKVYAPGKNALSYEGQWKNNTWDGRGTLIWRDGTKYEGQWKDGKRHGQGLQTYPPDDKEGRLSFNGAFANDMTNGSGILTMKNGERLAGVFKDDQLYNGSYQGADGREKASVVNGQRRDSAPAYDPCGHVYVGKTYWRDAKLFGLNVGAEQLQVVGFSSSSQRVSVRSLTSGYSNEVRCGDIPY